MKVRIQIDTQTFVRFVAVLGGFVLAAWLIWLLRLPLQLLFISAFLALALNPPVAKLAGMLPRHSRIGATAIAYLIVVGIIGALLVLAVPPAVRQTVIFSQQVPRYIDTLQDQRAPLRDFLARYNLENQLDTAVDNAKSQADDFAQGVGTAFVSGVGSLLNGVLTLLTVLVLTFFMLVEGPAWVRRLWTLYVDEAKRDRHRELVKRMYKVVSGYVNGQVLVAAIAGTASLAVLLVLGAVFHLPFSMALPLAAVIFLSSMIPMIGATIGAVIVVIVLLFNSVTAALIFLAYYLIYQQIENNVIQPVVQSRSVELTALGVLTAVIIGISLFGILGAIVAIPVAGCIRVLVTDWIERRQQHAESHHENMVTKAKHVLKHAAK